MLGLTVWRKGKLGCFSLHLLGSPCSSKNKIEEIKVWNFGLELSYLLVWNTSMEFMYGKYGFVGWETLLTLSLPMFGFEEPYLCIKVIFVGFSSVLWLALGVGWKFPVNRGKPVKITSDYRYSTFSTNSQSCFWSR